MSSRYNVHPKFAQLILSPDVRRRTGLALAFVVFGSVAGATWRSRAANGWPRACYRQIGICAGSTQDRRRPSHRGRINGFFG